MSMKQELRIIVLAMAILAGLLLTHDDPVTVTEAVLFGPMSSL